MEARYGLRDHADQEIREALDWMIKREREHESGRLHFERTDYDRLLTGGYRSETGEYVRVKYPKSPTGENWHAGIESVYLVLFWEKESPDLAKRARASFLNVYPGPLTRPEKVELGFHCCGSCNAVYQKTLKLADPELYAKQEEAFIGRPRDNRTSTGRWKISKSPFYYMILTLDEIGTEAAKDELANVAKHIRPSLVNRYRGDDRISRFRRLALQTALEYQ